MQSGNATAAAAKAILVQSGLVIVCCTAQFALILFRLCCKQSFDALGKIWELSDFDKKGALDREEFMIAMYLVDEAQVCNDVYGCCLDLCDLLALVERQCCA